MPEMRRGDEEADKERKRSRTAYQAGSDPRIIQRKKERKEVGEKNADSAKFETSNFLYLCSKEGSVKGVHGIR